MTVTNRLPQNTNYLQASKFLLMFDRIPDVQYFCQSVNIPGVSLPNATYNTPTLDIPIAGSKINYNHLDITFTVNEGAQDWQKMYEWFLALGSPDQSQRKSLIAQQTGAYYVPQKSYSDCVLSIMSALNNPLFSVQFFNAVPVSLGDIQFDTKSNADDIITATATFMYEYFIFLPA